MTRDDKGENDGQKASITDDADRSMSQRHELPSSSSPSQTAPITTTTSITSSPSSPQQTSDDVMNAIEDMQATHRSRSQQKTITAKQQKNAMTSSSKHRIGDDSTESLYYESKHKASGVSSKSRRTRLRLPDGDAVVAQRTSRTPRNRNEQPSPGSGKTNKLNGGAAAAAAVATTVDNGDNNTDDGMPPPPALTQLRRQEPRRREQVFPGAQRIRPGDSNDDDDETSDLDLSDDDDDDIYYDDEFEYVEPSTNLRDSVTSSSSVVHARIVNDDEAEGEEEDNVVAEAEPLEEENKTPRRILFCVLLCLMLILIVTLSVELTKPNNPTPTQTPSMMPSMSPTFSSDALLTLLKENSFDNGLSIETPGSPQEQAANWILAHEGNILLHRYTDDRIVQRYAMAVFYYSLDGDFWLNNQNWLNVTADECEWYLQSERPCADNGTMKDMILQQNLLSGTLPPEIGLLTELETLDLTFNNIEGTLPTEMGFMEELENMILSANKLTGTIPSGVFVNMSNLRILALDNNEFVCVSNSNNCNTDSECTDDGGEIRNMSMFPTEFWSLTNLQVASVGNNKFESNYPERCMLPSDVGRLTRLERLSLENLRIEGSIPSEIGLLSNLVSFVLPNEQKLESTIPTELGSLTRLLSLDLYDTFTFSTGTLPSEIGQMTALQELSLRSMFGGIIAEIGQLTNLKTLEIQDSFLSGTIPTEIGLATSLTSIDLRRNSLSGEIPSELGLLTRLEHLALDGWVRNLVVEEPIAEDIYSPPSTRLTGTIPTEIGLLTRLTELSLSSTFVSGSVPSELGLLTDLIALFLDRSELDGSIEDLACHHGTRRIPFASATITRVECSCCLLKCIVEEMPDPFVWPPDNTTTIEVFICLMDNGTEVS